MFQSPQDVIAIRVRVNQPSGVRGLMRFSHNEGSSRKLMAKRSLFRNPNGFQLNREDEVKTTGRKSEERVVNMSKQGGEWHDAGGW